MVFKKRVVELMYCTQTGKPLSCIILDDNIVRETIFSAMIQPIKADLLCGGLSRNDEAHITEQLKALEVGAKVQLENEMKRLKKLKKTIRGLARIEITRYRNLRKRLEAQGLES